MFGLPDRVAAMFHPLELVQGTDAGQLGEVAAVELRDAGGEILNVTEGAVSISDADEDFGRALLEATDVHEAEAEGKRAVGLVFDGALPTGDLNVDGLDAQMVALRIFDQHGGHVKAHRLVVEHGAGEGGEIVNFEVRGGVRDECEAGSVRLGKAVERE